MFKGASRLAVSKDALCSGLLLAVMLLAMSISVGLYFYLNRIDMVKEPMFAANEPRLEHYVDACEVSSGKAYIKGWMLLRAQTENSLIYAYVENQRGQWFALNTRLIKKPAAYNKFGLAYPKGKVGFAAAGRVEHLGATPRFLVVKQGKNDNAYGVYHVCE